MRVYDPEKLAVLVPALLERGERATIVTDHDDDQRAYAIVEVRPDDVTKFSYWLAQLDVGLRLQAYADKLVVSE